MMLLFAAAILSPAAPAAAQAPYEVVRMGDRAMACPQLIAEINDINRQLQDQQMRQTAAMSEATSGMMGGARMGAGGMVMGSLAGMVPFGGTVLSMGRQAQMEAGRRKMTGQMEAMQREAMETMPARERLEHLMGLYEAKAC